MPYAELHCHSNFSFLDGASHPEELAEEAARLGLEALAVTDHNGFYGVVRFAEAAQAVGLPTVFGAELTAHGPRPSVGRRGRRRRRCAGRHRARARLARSRPARRAPPGDRRRTRPATPGWPGRSASASSPGRRARRSSAFDDLADGPGRPLVGAHRVPQGGGAGGAGGRRAGRGAPRAAPAGRAVRARPGAGRAVGPRRSARLGPQRRARRAGRSRTTCECVATNNVHYATPAQRRLATALAAVRARRSLDELDPWLPGGHRRPPALRRRAGAAVPPLPRRGRARRRDRPGRGVRPVARRPEPAAVPVPRREPTVGRHEMAVPAPARRRRAPPRYGERLRREDLSQRARAWRTIDHELGADRAARLRRLLPRRVGHRRVLPAGEHLLPGAGQRREPRGLLRARHHQRRRGGARPAVRAVPVARARRPARHRHRHRERPPRGGHPVRLRALRPRTTPRRSPTSSPTGPSRRCATWPRRSATPPGQQDAWSKQIDAWGDRVATTAPAATARHPRRTCSSWPRRSRTSPRHLGIHSGGMVICDRPVVEVCPVEWARMEDRSVLQWDKDDCAAAGW